MSHKASHTNTVQYYDRLYKDWIGEKQTQGEINLIKQLTPQKGKILDIACGTGRHLVPLYHQGFDVVGIERSLFMIDQLKKKLGAAHVITTEFSDTELEDQDFNTAICMWNAIYEIAQSDEDLEEFFQKLYQFLKDKGILIIATSDSDNFEPQEYDFDYQVKDEDKTIRLNWKLLEFRSETNTTRSREHIEVYQEDKLIDVCETEIIQRHWLQDELVDMAESGGFSVQLRALKASSQKYFICQKF